MGMLNQLAMIVVAKKLGLGSWMSYIDKYGVPPVFVITDRMDAARHNELSEMMTGYRQSMWAILEGNERIEVPKISETNSHQVYLSLIDSVCNKEISKRVPGGTATVEEKSFVGSAEVQERVAQDRHEADKLLFKYVFNAHIRKRLVKISPAYAGFEQVTFEWNNQETLDIKDYIDAVQKLSTAFEFDVEEIKARTGLPVTGVRQEGALSALPPEPAGPGKNSQKKKPDANAGYGLTAAAWNAEVEKLTERIWNGQAAASELDSGLVTRYYKSLNKAAQNGWGKDYYDEPLTRNFRENLLKFSGAKSYNLIRKITELKNGSPDRETYTEAAKRMISVHNETYQKVEDKFAANSASAARDFTRYVKDKDIYPCLKNRTMADGNVRQTHAVNEGIIKPVNEWRQIPPYDPGCRCWLEQTDEKPNDRQLSNIDERWANNPAVSGELFIEKHSYFTGIDEKDWKAVSVNTDSMKEFMPYNKTIKVGDNSIFINDFADLRDLKSNIEAAKIIADFLKKNIYIRPHIEKEVGKKNPEFGIGQRNIIADLKTMEKPNNFFSHGIEKACKQGCRYVVMNIDVYKGDVRELASRIEAGFIYKGKQVNRRISKIFIIRNGKTVQLTRKQVNRGKFGDLGKL